MEVGTIYLENKHLKLSSMHNSFKNMQIEGAFKSQEAYGYLVFHGTC